MVLHRDRMIPPKPPRKYDGEPAFDYKVMTVSPSQVKELCRGIERACAYPKRRVIVISNELKGKVRQAFLRHEKAHLNGWLDCRETVMDDHDHDPLVSHADEALPPDREGTG